MINDLVRHQSSQLVSTTERLQEYSDWLAFAIEQRSFQMKEVLKMVVQTEQQRIQNETAAWRLGAGVVGLMFGMTDGFQMGDMFQAMAFGTAAGFAHNKFSEKERKFLKDIEFDWAMGEHAPQTIDQRLGRAVSRFIVPVENGMIIPFSIRKGLRGEHMLPLGLAEYTCPGFININSRQVMERTFNQDGIETLAKQFFPSPLQPTKCQSVRKIHWEEVDHNFGELNDVAQKLNYEPMVIEAQNEKIYGYRADIPYHSDY